MGQEYEDDDKDGDVWARPEMSVTFRAEIMPGVSREERTFRIATVLANHRVTLHGFAGEFREAAFEALDFKRDAANKS